MLYADAGIYVIGYLIVMPVLLLARENADDSQA